jgi:DNA-binding GntR family transcriptional regulator
MKRATGGGHFTSRGRELFVPSIVLDRESGVALHRQIYLQIGDAIRSGAIRHGARLPSTRVMAKILGLSRNTMLAAYDELATENLLHGERGAGMRVNGAPATEVSWFGLRQVIRAAGYPARVVRLEDPDGNGLYLCG